MTTPHDVDPAPLPNSFACSDTSSPRSQSPRHGDYCALLPSGSHPLFCLHDIGAKAEFRHSCYCVLLQISPGQAIQALTLLRLHTQAALPQPTTASEIQRRNKPRRRHCPICAESLFRRRLDCIVRTLFLTQRAYALKIRQLEREFISDTGTQNTAQRANPKR